MVLVLPRRSNSCSCSTRRNFDCSSSGNVADFIQKQRSAVGQLEAAQLLGNRSRKGSLLVPEELAFQEAGRNGGAVQLHKRARPPAAQVMDRAGDQLFACAGLSLNQDGRVGWCDDLDLVEHLPERGALADDLFEVVFGANFILEVQLFLVQLFLQLGDLTICESVLDGNRDLLRDLRQQLDLVSGERLFSQAADVQCSENPVVGQQWNATERFHALVRAGAGQSSTLPPGLQIVRVEQCGRSGRQGDAAGETKFGSARPSSTKLSCLSGQLLVFPAST